MVCYLGFPAFPTPYPLPREGEDGRCGALGRSPSAPQRPKNWHYRAYEPGNGTFRVSPLTLGGGGGRIEPMQ
jgi:hypothetical protein